MTDPDWRTRHCAEPAVERLKQATGRDLWAEFGGCPRSAREAAAFYRKLGVTSLRDAVTAVLGKSVDPKLASRGDIAMVDNALGVVRGDLIECLNGTVPLSRASGCWQTKRGGDG